MSGEALADPLRVLMTADAVGGVWTYALDLCRALAPAGVQFDLAVLGPSPSNGQRQAAAALSNVRVHEWTGRLEWMDNPWADVDACGRWLLELADRTSPGLVHLNGYAHAAQAWNVPVVVAAHSCVLSWWLAALGTAAPARYTEYRQRVAEGLAAASLVVAPSRWMLDQLELLYTSLPDGRVIWNGRSGRAFQPGPKEDFLLAAGRLWDKGKNITALDAVAKHLNHPVHVAGAVRSPDGDLTDLRQLRLLGELAPGQMAAWMARAAVFALPSRYEPFGLAALEAALSGCALVLNGIASLREIWDDAAIFVDFDEPVGASRAIQALFDDPAQRSEWAGRAAARARTFSLESMGSAYLEAYRTLLQRKPLACAS